jgi:aromatic-amino-acid transaminase
VERLLSAFPAPTSRHPGQRGMFSFSNLTKAQVQTLRDEFSIYAIDTGRVCVAALNSRNVDDIAAAVANVIR